MIPKESGKVISYDDLVTDYEKIQKSIMDAPASYLPGLLSACVVASLKKNVFMPGKLTKFVDGAQELYNKTLGKGQSDVRNVDQ